MIEQNYIEIIDGLHREWEPHPGQIEVGQAYFSYGFQSIFVQCGRKWGKTEMALYLLWRIAKSFPGVPCYYIAPLQVQAREIVWADPRIKHFGPRDWLLPGSSGINNTEMRLNFKNGSFIKIDGSDNFEKYRGVKFKVCVYEEFKDHRPEFRRGMRPNAAVLNGLEVFIGTPPDHECDFTTLADEHKADPNKYFKHAPTSENPHISKEWLENEKKTLYARGEGDLYEREHNALFVPGGSTKIFPMVHRGMVRPHDEIMRELYKDRKKLTWILWADPAASTCFAILFIALNPYTKKIYCLDEIYEKEQGKMSVLQIGNRLIEKRNELNDHVEWVHGYDEAETWWANEWHDNFPDEEAFTPTHKSQSKKEVGLTLIEDIMLADNLVLSDRVENLFTEMDQYFKDKKGKIPKKNDHLIDDLRYILAYLGYSLVEEEEYLEEKNEDFRGEPLRLPSEHDLDDDFDDWN